MEEVKENETNFVWRDDEMMIGMIGLYYSMRFKFTRRASLRGMDHRTIYH